MGNECFWASFRPGELEFCEEKLCSYIVSPAETWSNLAYLIIALIILMRFLDRPGAKRFALYAALVGVFSFVYHMSHIWFLETLDLGSMLFLGVHLVCMNLIRLSWLRPERSRRVYWVIVIAAWALLFVLRGKDRLGVFAGVIVMATWFEALLFVRARRLGRLPNYRAYGISLGLFAVSYAFWILDETKTWCDPKAHYWSGHALWHVVNSGCFLTLMCHFSQFVSPSPLASGPGSQVLSKNL